MPYFVFFGRDANLPISDLINGKRNFEENNGSYNSDVLERLKKAYKKVNYNNDLAHKRMIKYTKTKDRKFNVGDIVMVTNPKRSGPMRKYQPYWVGPYRIVQKISEVTVKVKPIYNKRQKGAVIHIDRLKFGPIPLSEMEELPSLTSKNLIIENPENQNKDGKSNDGGEELTSSDDEVDDEPYLIRTRPKPHQYALRSQGPVHETEWIPCRPVESKRARVANCITLLLMGLLLHIIFN